MPNLNVAGFWDQEVPLIDRNPQKFVPNIYEAKAEDFVAATQRVYTSRERPSHIVLPVVRN